MSELENLRAEKIAQEESSKSAQKKLEQELSQLKAQKETLQTQVNILKISLDLVSHELTDCVKIMNPKYH